MNKLWVFVGGCVTGAMGLLAAAAVANGAAEEATRNDVEGVDEACVEDGGEG